MADLTIPAGAIADAVEALDANDERARIGRAEGLTLRILKVGEEFGEVARARIGGTGQNPRKGVTHGAADLRDELFDVALTALVAAATVDPDWAFAFGLHVKAKTARVVEAVSNA
jgi:NTP pyrophosphatase (non-canonical NTP hydrolase)